MLRNGLGIGVLPAPFPLIITLALIFRIQFSPTDELIAFHFPLAALFLALNLRLRLRAVFILSIITTFGYLFVGNLLFQNGICEFESLLIIERTKTICAANAALPRTVMLLYGFAWINSGDVDTFAKTFLRLSSSVGSYHTLPRYISAAAQYFSQLYRENEAVEQAIKFHLTARSLKVTLATRLSLTWARMNSIIFKMFYAIPDLAYVLATRYRKKPVFTSTKPQGHKIDLISFKRDNNAVPLKVRVSPVFLSPNLMSLDELSEPEARAIIDTISGIVPHIRGEVSGQLALDNFGDLLGINETQIFSLSRYVGGESNLRQLLGPTVELELAGSCCNKKEMKFSLTYWGLNGYEKRRIQELSGGQRVRLAAASAMASDAKIILLDNVEGQLDAEGRQLLSAWIREEANTDRIFIKYETNSNETQKTTSMTTAIIPVHKGNQDTPVISVKNIKLIRGSRTLLEKWSYDFYPGRLTIITGPNGAGKTSLALALAGAIDIADGKIIRNCPIGMSFQTPMDQFSRFTVINELAVRPEIAGIARQVYRSVTHSSIMALALDEESEIIGLQHSQLRFLSVFGMLYNTGCLVLDEPSSQLTRMEINLMVKQIELLTQSGVSVILISHDPSLWPKKDLIELVAT